MDGAGRPMRSRRPTCPSLRASPQFYTGVVSLKVATRFPAVAVAYQTLLKHQMGPYRVHEHWASEGASPGEIVRLASRSRADPRGWGVPGGRARFRHELEKLGF